MKKLFLLLTAGVLTVAANAQNHKAVRSMVLTNNGNSALTDKTQMLGENKLINRLNAGRTTTGPGGARWYNYVDSILAMNTSSVAGIGASILTIWEDTTAVVGYDNSGTPTYYINTWTSVGTSLNPFYSAWNDSTVFPHEIKIGATDNYVIDSVAIFGQYVRSESAPGSYTDSLRLGFVYGDGSSTSDLPGYYFTGMTAHYGVDTVEFIDLLHDSLNNRASGSTMKYFSFPLTAADTATNFGNIYPVNVPVPAR